MQQKKIKQLPAKRLRPKREENLLLCGGEVTKKQNRLCRYSAYKMKETEN